MARKPVDSPQLPKVDQCLVDRVHTYLTGHFDMKRPPEVASRLLALLIELYKREIPYPPRSVVAEYIDASPFGLDAAINRALERGLISVETRLASGQTNSRTTVVQHKFYVPSDELMQAVQAKPRMFGRRRVA